MTKIDDFVILSHLDDVWRTPPAVHKLVGYRGEGTDITGSLRRLATMGKVETKFVDTTVPKTNEKRKSYHIEYYRKS